MNKNACDLTLNGIQILITPQEGSLLLPSHYSSLKVRCLLKCVFLP